MRRPSRRLGLEPLEAREVPAGVVTARLAAGVLTLTGTGADRVTLDGVPVGVMFQGRTTIRAGDGNDELTLGTPPAGADAASWILFVTTGNRIDGEAGYFGGIELGTGIVSWVDPTP